MFPLQSLPFGNRGATPSTSSTLSSRLTPFGSQPPRSRALNTRLIVCGGGRKENKKPKGYGKEPDPASKPPEPPPPVQRRIVDTSHLSLKTQLRLVKAVKQAQKPSAPAVRTTFRRDKDEVITERERRLRENEEASKTVGKYSLTSLYGTKRGTNPPVLVVDGYNVIGQDKKLSKLRDSNQLEAARTDLQEMMISWSNTRGVRCIIVYDAAHSGRLEESWIELEQGITLVFSPELDADGWIAAAVPRLFDTGASKVVVATGDQMLQDMSFGNGALIMSSRVLLEDIKAAKAELAKKTRAQAEGSLAGKRLLAGLSGDVLNKLQAIRLGGSQSSDDDEE